MVVIYFSVPSLTPEHNRQTPWDSNRKFQSVCQHVHLCCKTISRLSPLLHSTLIKKCSAVFMLFPYYLNRFEHIESTKDGKINKKM